MRLGIASALPHSSAEEWGKKHAEAGLKAVAFPCSYIDDQKRIDEYYNACREFDLRIAEVGSWCNVLANDPDAREENITRCIRQLELAEYLRADCCVNIAGSAGGVYNEPCPGNLTPETYGRVIETIRRIIDAVNPQNTFYTLEPCSWMFPYSPENYLQMIKDVDRKGFAVHMDIINMIDTPEKYWNCADFTDHAFRLLGPEIKSCHIKDIMFEKRCALVLKEVPCGDGEFDLCHYISKIDEISPEMTVIIEHLETTEQYVKSVLYIQNLMKNV